MKPIRWKKPQRMIALTAIDEAAFSVLLKDAIPEIVFASSRVLKGLGNLNSDLTGPWIDAHASGSIHTVVNDPVNIFVPSCIWRPMPVVIKDRTYHLRGPSLKATYLRGVWDWRTHHGAKLAYDPPTLGFGYLSTSFLTDDRQAQAFWGRVLKLLRKVTTDRVRSELPHSGYVLGEGRADYLVGHDAYRWCSESPTRMIAGIARPTLDWAFPDKPWYRAVEGVDRGVKGPPESRTDQTAASRNA